jgi:acyl carrier protein
MTQPISSLGFEKRRADDIKSWLIDYLSALLEIEADRIDTTTPFERYGLDSSAMVVLSGDLQTWLECSLEPTLLYDYPTIDVLTEYLVEKLDVKS